MVDLIPSYSQVTGGRWMMDKGEWGKKSCEGHTKGIIMRLLAGPRGLTERDAALEGCTKQREHLERRYKASWGRMWTVAFLRRLTLWAAC